jgi:hypothetical protein
VIIAMKNSIPAKFPKNETNHIFRTSSIPTRRCRKAVVINYTTYETSLQYGVLHEPLTMILEVNKSDPVSTIKTSPIGNMRAATVRIKPGAFS